MNRWNNYCIILFQRPDINSPVTLLESSLSLSALSRVPILSPLTLSSLSLRRICSSWAIMAVLAELRRPSTSRLSSSVLPRFFLTYVFRLMYFIMGVVCVRCANNRRNLQNISNSILKERETVYKGNGKMTVEEDKYWEREKDPIKGGQNKGLNNNQGIVC